MASSDFQPVLNFDRPVTIAVGETISTAVDVYGTCIGALITDANLTGTALTFLCSDSLNGTYLSYKDLKTGAAAAAVVTTSGYYATAPIDFSFVRFIKVVSGTIQATADSVVTLVTRRLS